MDNHNHTYPDSDFPHDYPYESLEVDAEFSDEADWQYTQADYQEVIETHEPPDFYSDEDTYLPEDPAPSETEVGFRWTPQRMIFAALAILLIAILLLQMIVPALQHALYPQPIPTLPPGWMA